MIIFYRGLPINSIFTLQTIYDEYVFAVRYDVGIALCATYRSIQSLPTRSELV
ncbi:protein of unknown function [Xenorhabdus bovienii]|uniref:Uncharacterized protein n=1 Tax=Xenorhabdus bovienii TaxID=40576 RepID=A0A0B6X5N9_XENBV|nr:protein of unknown function [Xenorhabdus bovienii]